VIIGTIRSNSIELDHTKENKSVQSTKLPFMKTKHFVQQMKVGFVTGETEACATGSTDCNNGCMDGSEKTA
jgi:hypothetical protein